MDRTEINLNSYPIAYSSKSDLYASVGKRLFEIFLISIVFVPLLLLILSIYLALLFPNRGRVIFKQKRVGFKGKQFTIYKFRTLYFPVEINIEKDPLVIRQNSHPIGFFLRKTGLDELLQLVNVIRGEMNLIGPRPLLAKDLNHLTQSQFHRRHMIKPGILGLWQIRRKYCDDKNYYRYDNFYQERQSLLFDLYIVVSTIEYMLKGKGR